LICTCGGENTPTATNYHTVNSDYWGVVHMLMMMCFQHFKEKMATEEGQGVKESAEKIICPSI
jgi:hypothetical protein